jgi:hypothetical protein
MQNIDGTKVKILFFLLVLIGMSLACNYPDATGAIVEAAVEQCFTVDRSKYENYADQLGQVPETPKYPESAVYEACFIDRELSLVRMSDGYRSEEDENDGSIPAGTYEGTITDTKMATRGLVEWEVQGSVESNEITIIVANDGTVSGSFIYVKTGNILFSDDSHGITCTDSNDQSFIGEATGQLTNNTGRIVFEIQHTIVSKLTDGCSTGPKEDTTVSDIRQHFEIEIIDGEMVGTSIPSTEDGHPVKATFRCVKSR